MISPCSLNHMSVNSATDCMVQRHGDFIFHKLVEDRDGSLHKKFQIFAIVVQHMSHIHRRRQTQPVGMGAAVKPAIWPDFTNTCTAHLEYSPITPISQLQSTDLSREVCNWQQYLPIQIALNDPNKFPLDSVSLFL